ncbi:hypothetical protein [Meiothermus taiwanensis]|jgi:succinate-acetate transporter protein|uniref:Uncharacterized protein n=2 Tax=Meiothermus taiwanensis TaxID=172827 RepID=A0A399DZ68_9DEIN|nr:hypothetical protein [Meiothermus taiwanensis]AWR85323.1 hypothetical protein Mtai_v1c00710 [Meiothermus taiwanensis WR-220]KIQ55794.1 hypothetical protein SY28_01685 [Meiothermus taiwanensis]KZK15877.1 hypothetical protein A3962_08350 [Meiothermus taiwanensis]RIH77545.1 hypothetical protein Mcate_01279 [Meiothermus taiwanensis]
MFGFIWFLFTVFAAFAAAQLVRRPRLWRTEAPALGEVVSVWLILTLVMAGALVGLRELLVQFWPQSPAGLSSR